MHTTALYLHNNSGLIYLHSMSVLHPLVKSMKDLPKDAKLPLPQIASMIDYSGPQLTKKVGGPIDVATSAILKFPMPQLPAWEKEPGAEQSITSTIQTSFVARTTKCVVHLPTFLNRFSRLTGMLCSERTVLIQGSRGDIIVPFPPFKATAFEVRAWDTIQDKRDEKPPSFQKRYEQDFPGGIAGFAYEADATARCIRDGQTECERMRALRLSYQCFGCLQLIERCVQPGERPSFRWRSLTRSESKMVSSTPTAWRQHLPPSGFFHTCLLVTQC